MIDEVIFSFRVNPEIRRSVGGSSKLKEVGRIMDELEKASIGLRGLYT